MLKLENHKLKCNQELAERILGIEGVPLNVPDNCQHNIDTLFGILKLSKLDKLPKFMDKKLKGVSYAFIWYDWDNSDLFIYSDKDSVKLSLKHPESFKVVGVSKGIFEGLASTGAFDYFVSKYLKRFTNWNDPKEIIYVDVDDAMWRRLISDN